MSMIHKTVNKDIHKFKFYYASNNFFKVKRNRQLGTRLIAQVPYKHEDLRSIPRKRLGMVTHLLIPLSLNASETGRY